MIKKDLSMSTRKHAKKFLRTAIKQDLSLDYTILGVLENEIIATSHSNTGSLKTAIKEEWNKMSEEFILKVCKPFQRRVDTIIEKKKNGGHIELIYCLMFVFLFCCLWF